MDVKQGKFSQSETDAIEKAMKIYLGSVGLNPDDYSPLIRYDIYLFQNYLEIFLKRGKSS